MLQLYGVYLTCLSLTKSKWTLTTCVRLYKETPPEPYKLSSTMGIKHTTSKRINWKEQLCVTLLRAYITACVIPVAGPKQKTFLAYSCSIHLVCARVSRGNSMRISPNVTSCSSNFNYSNHLNTRQVFSMVTVHSKTDSEEKLVPQ